MKEVVIECWRHKQPAGKRWSKIKNSCYKCEDCKRLREYLVDTVVTGESKHVLLHELHYNSVLTDSKL